MEMDLKNIIEKIKTEGVTEGEKEASRIIDQAKGKAKSTIDSAEKTKKEIIEKAKLEAEKLEKSAEEAIKQASRNVLLGLRESIIALFDKVVRRSVAEDLTPDVMQKMILGLIDNFRKEGSIDIEVLLSEKDKKDLEKSLLDKLTKEMKKGVVLKAAKGMEHGFRIGEKDSNSYYDFTDEAIEEAFKAYLNKRLTEILTLGAKGA